ncbi:MAG: hypothetical protein NZ455_10430 [Bacteroidia bacterium]|nr:hypothetical protein [Bacteroidia bacterium]
MGIAYLLRSLREACEGRAVARCEAKRSTEAIAQPVARRPCGYERSETPTRTRPKNFIFS